MRITICLSIAIFISTLYWSQLLNQSELFICLLLSLFFFCWSKWRFLLILPLTALYFSLFTNITLLGLPAFQFDYFSKPLVGFLSKSVNNVDNNITVKIKSLINERNHGYFIAKVMTLNDLHCSSCPLIEVRWFNPTLQVQAGQVHRFRVRLKPLLGKGNPEGGDRQKWRYSEHVAYIASVKSHLQILDPSITIRAKLYQKILSATQHLPQQGALLALIFADKSLITQQEKQLIKALGIAHLFAISGLHIGLLFMFSFVLINFLLKKTLPAARLGWFSWYLTHICALSVCLIYGYLSGFSLPTQRALVMLIITVFIFSNKQKIGLFDLLIVALWLILLMDPLAVLSSSLWLSFTAMSIIFVFIWGAKIVIQEATLKPLPWWQKSALRMLFFIKGLVLLQLLLTLFMLPIQLINFSAISLFSLMINLVAIPLFSWPIIPTTLLAVLLFLMYQPIGLLLLEFSNWLLEVFFSLFSPFSFAYLLLSELSIIWILSFLLFLLFMFFWGYLRRFFYFHTTPVILIVICLIAFVSVRRAELYWYNKETWQLEVFDVGQGLSVLLQSEGQFLLYDTGPSYLTHYVTAEAEILPYLQARGITQLDYLIVSHSDNDHAGGVHAISEALHIKQAYAGEAYLMRTNNVSYQQCLAGDVFHLGKLTLQVLSPRIVGKNNNNNSCVLKVSDGKNSVLLTGDISQRIERNLLREDSAALLQSDILIAPHHGSKTASSQAFIEKVNPRWVVFAAGYKNRWHFPAAPVLERYQKQGVMPLTTGYTGFIRFNVKNQHIEMKTYREDLAAYWYHQELAF